VRKKLYYKRRPYTAYQIFKFTVNGASSSDASSSSVGNLTVSTSTTGGHQEESSDDSGHVQRRSSPTKSEGASTHYSSCKFWSVDSRERKPRPQPPRYNGWTAYEGSGSAGNVSPVNKDSFCHCWLEDNDHMQEYERKASAVHNVANRANISDHNSTLRHTP
jgi:hypothetical protein